MEQGIIRIYNPLSKPFGPLSNNYIHPIVINNKVWLTVTNFILSNMLTTPIYQLALQNSPIQGDKKQTNIKDKFIQLVSNREYRLGRTLTKYEKTNLRKSLEDEFAIQKLSIYRLFDYYLELEVYNTIRTAVEKAYTVLIKEYPLLQTV
jgi:hypothetical protein